LHDWLDPVVLGRELDDYLAGRRPIGLQVWRWLSLDSWARRFIVGDPRLTAPSPWVLSLHHQPRSGASLRQPAGAAGF